MNSKPQTTNIGITGATGLLGSYLCRTLVDKGYNLICLHRSSSSFELINDLKDKIEWIEGDLMDYDALEELCKKSDIIIHSAAKISYNKKDKESLFKTNIQGTAEIINHALEQDIKHFIHISSVAALGGQGKNITEEHKWDEELNHSDYGISKYQAELEVWRGMAEGLPVTIFNPSMILGEGLWDQGSSTIFKKAYNGLPFYPTGSNGFVAAKDVSAFVLKAIELGPTNERYILNGANLPFKTVLDWIAEVYEIRPIKRPLSPFMISMATFLSSIINFIVPANALISKTSLEISSRTTSFSNQKSIENFKIEYSDIKQVVKSCASKFLEQQKQ